MSCTIEWRLGFDELKLVCGDKHFASVFTNGTWYTWDSNGNGHENSKADTIEQAQAEAAHSAIGQGLLTL